MKEFVGKTIAIMIAIFVLLGVIFINYLLFPLALSWIILKLFPQITLSFIQLTAIFVIVMFFINMIRGE